MGAAIPTVRPSPMLIVPRTVFFGVSVVNLPCSDTVAPSRPMALPLHV
jgi:hypothetical protein